VNERADWTIEVHGAVLITRGASRRGCRDRCATGAVRDRYEMGMSERQEKLNRQGEQRQAGTDANFRSDPTHTSDFVPRKAPSGPHHGNEQPVVSTGACAHRPKVLTG